MPIAAETKREATYQDVIDAPEHMVAELIDGQLYLSPRPASPHFVAATAVGSELYVAFGKGGGRPGGWWIADEPELHFGRDVLVPDIAGWRRERLPAMPTAAAMTLAPDWICEVVSLSSASRDRIHKMAVYARENVAYLWLVDVSQRILEIFRLEAGRWVRLNAFGGNERIRAEPFDAVELDMSDWWLPDEPAAGG